MQVCILGSLDGVLSVNFSSKMGNYLCAHSKEICKKILFRLLDFGHFRLGLDGTSGRSPALFDGSLSLDPFGRVVCHNYVLLQFNSGVLAIHFWGFCFPFFTSREAAGQVMA